MYGSPLFGTTRYIISLPLARDSTVLEVESSPIIRSPTSISCTIFVVPSYINIGVSFPRHLPLPQGTSKIAPPPLGLFLT